MIKFFKSSKRDIPQIIAQITAFLPIKSEELIDEFAREYLKNGMARWGVLYIDGHVLPYYGIYCIKM
ncbi:MAG: hypothetical protein HY920_06540 [Elusimicrobia bacterium]|nr:hypothetical protein [Elusimicrobiota bacterium]